MTELMDWLEARVPDFGRLSDDELNAILEFTFIWSLFEARMVATSATADRIEAEVRKWGESELLDAEICSEEIAYFRQRYFANGEFTHHFDHLRLRSKDREPLVRQVLDGSSSDPVDYLVAALIIVFRYRNNLFHGLKWQYQLAGQFENFTHANNLLKNVLQQYGHHYDG